ncbi:MAG TPA: c-type cytochrome, partial [Rhodopila sp.]|nr:c-type cytochrome [Rhodopila sp.]
MVDGQGRRDAQPSAGWRVIAGLLGVMALCAAAPDQSGSNPASGDLVAKGKYLTVLGDCASCHTAANGAKYAGGRYMPTPFGPISTPNITPDKKTGIGSYTDDQFVRVFHDGINAKGEYLYPVMPYPWFTKLSRDDILAIKAYLFSLKPVDAPRKPIKLTFPFNIR